ncbi:hypothetical protein V8F20_005784 [Naviculisporaceae sp. PSN 640]
MGRDLAPWNLESAELTAVRLALHTFFFLCVVAPTRLQNGMLIANATMQTNSDICSVPSGKFDWIFGTVYAVMFATVSYKLYSLGGLAVGHGAAYVRR